MSRENLKLLIVATVCLAAGWTGPAVAAVTFAQNSDKVDGKHAVGAGATTTQRKGKLVATSPTTGRLPNNIVAVAPDAARLGAVPAANMRVSSINTRSLLDTGTATLDGFGPWLLAGSTGGFRTIYLVPPGRKAMAPLKIDLTVWAGSSSCTFRGKLEVLTAVTSLPGTSAYTLDGVWSVLPANDSYKTITFTVTPNEFLNFPAQQAVEIEFLRDAVAGTCGGVEVVGMQVRY